MFDKVKFIDISTNNGISTKFGTIDDNKHPSVILLRGKGRVKPINRYTNYEDDVIGFRKAFEKEIHYCIQSSKVYSNDCFINVELSSKNVIPNRYSYVRYDIYLKPNKLRTLPQQKRSVIKISKAINESMVSLLKKNFLIKID